MNGAFKCLLFFFLGQAAARRRQEELERQRREERGATGLAALLEGLGITDGSNNSVESSRESSGGGGGSSGGKTDCELCDGNFSNPVTFHMKKFHKGCGRSANGMGYNSRGQYVSGWQGDCGAGGQGSSTWYLLCRDCRAKYLRQV